MSFPGPVGGAANLGCDTGLQRATDHFNFVVDNGGAEPAPTTPSNLQSPATVLPDTNGNVNLSLGASTGSGNANLAVSCSTGNLATISISTSPGGLSSLLMGQTGTPGAGVRIIAPADGSGQLKIDNATSGVPVAVFDTSGGTVALNATTIQTVAGGANGLSLAPVSATNSIINQTIAGSGVVGIGSSTAYPQTLRVSDVPYLMADCYVEVFGPAGTVPLFISAAQGPAGECGIHPDAAPGNGQLLLGSDNTNVSAIRISNTATTINNMGGAPQVLLAAQTIAPNASGTIPNPTGEGLYCIMGCSVATSSGQTRQAQVNVMAYVNTNGRIQMGGSGIADIGSIGGTDAFVLFPVDGTNTLFYQNNGAQSLLNYSIVAFKISGPILGAF